jgi:hypothetical protein
MHMPSETSMLNNQQGSTYKYQVAGNEITATSYQVKKYYACRLSHKYRNGQLVGKFRILSFCTTRSISSSTVVLRSRATIVDKLY